MKIFLACALTFFITMIFVRFMNKKHIRDFHGDSESGLPKEKEFDNVNQIIGSTVGEILSDANIIIKELKN